MTAVGAPTARRLAAAGALAFMAAGALLIAASWSRWGVPCWPDLDSPACLTVQDHRFDYLLPTEPWTPLGRTAHLAGVAYLMLAVGMALVFAAARSAGWARGLQALLVGSALGIGLVTLASARAGEPIGFEWVILPWLLSPLLVATILVDIVSLSDDRAVLSDRAWCAWAGMLILAHPFLGLVLTMIAVDYNPHDTTPWDGMLGGGAFVGAGLIVLTGLATRRRAPAQR
ncbi:hypothetical protein [Nakamurella sp.]|uniref:hypothetical protein n=1 Tax=Nakamurella sp. TaxID=1869182 RepID=UPI003783F74C